MTGVLITGWISKDLIWLKQNFLYIWRESSRIKRLPFQLGKTSRGLKARDFIGLNAGSLRESPA
jgi:hypothetical protein